MECEIKDRISDLPLFILHKILSRLPRKGAARTSVLSRRWHSVWNSFPFLDFDHTLDDDDVDGFVDLVDKSLQRCVRSNLLIERFDLNFYFAHDTDLLSRVDGWVESVMDNGVRDFVLSVASASERDGEGFTLLDYVLPEKTFVPKNIDGCSSRFYSLRGLSLNYIRISESIIRDIIHYCPNIEGFSLELFSGLKTLEISKLSKLLVLRVCARRGLRELVSVCVDAPNLKCFYYSSDEPNLPCKISLTSCHDLQDLSLNECAITDDLFHSYLSGFPRLEDLTMSRCYALQRVKISAHRLSRLRLSHCDKIEVIEIDAPHLSSFRYETSKMPILFSENVPCPMKITYVFRDNSRELSSSWFLKLREFLGASNQRKTFELNFVDKEVSFDIKEFVDAVVPPKFELDHLDLISSSYVRPIVDHATLIEALLWSCHPKTISVQCHSPFEKKCIEALCMKLLAGKLPTCCVGSHVKCWRHDFRSAKLASFGGIEDDEKLFDWSRLLSTLPSLTRYHQVCFTLVWDL